MKIKYAPIRQWVVFFLPAFLMCALPNYLGIATPKEDWIEFRFWFDLIVSVAFFGGVVYAIYAVVHNAMEQQ
jgi:hypothetical protein